MHTVSLYISTFSHSSLLLQIALEKTVSIVQAVIQRTVTRALREFECLQSQKYLNIFVFNLLIFVQVIVTSQYLVSASVQRVVWYVQYLTQMNQIQYIFDKVPFVYVKDFNFCEKIFVRPHCRTVYA